MNDLEPTKLIVFAKDEDLWVAFRLKEDGSPPYMKLNDFLERAGASFRVNIVLDNTDEGLKGLGIDVNPDWITPHDEE